MRDRYSEEREDRFDDRDRRDTERMQPRPRRPRVRRDEEEYEEEEERRPRYASRRPVSRREEEEYEEEERRPRRPRGRDYEDYEDEYDDEYEDDEYEHKKAPLLVRVFAWGALLAILFAAGYLGANCIFNWADKKGGPRIGDVVGSSSDVAKVDQKDAQSQQPADSTSYKMYIPDKNDFTERKIDIKKGRTEQDIDKVLSTYFDSLKETGMLSDNVKIINLFHSDNKLYINMSTDFADSVKKLSPAKATQIITGVIRTLQADFSVDTVKFYIDGQESKMTKPIDLTQDWSASDD
jgi:hypothetical protein